MTRANYYSDKPQRAEPKEIDDVLMIYRLESRCSGKGCCLIGMS